MATTTPPAGGSGEEAARATATLKGAKDFFSKTFSINLDSVVQIGAPRFRRDAERRAKDAKKKYPVDHLLRGDAMEVVYNILTANLKTAAQSLPNTPPPMAVLKTAIKEVAEYVDAFVQEFCNEENGEEAPSYKGPTKPIDTETKEAVAELLKTLGEKDAELAADHFAFIKNMPKDTPPGKMAVMNELLAGRVGSWQEQKNLLLHGLEKKAEPKEPGVPFKERLADVAQTVDEAVNKTLAPVNQELEQWLAKWEMSNQTRRQKIRAKVVPQKSSRLGKFVRWLTKP